MKQISKLALAFAFLAAQASLAHEAPHHDHRAIVPIPPYNLPHGPAGAASARAAAEALLETFSTNKKVQFMFDWTAPERTRWSNLPGGIFTRPGISIGELTAQQRDLLFAFLASSLGVSGYERLSEVLAAEAFLSEAPRAKRYGWFPENYWISFYGTPSANGAWGWSFGGHHLGLNISMQNGRVTTMSPSFVGTEPAVFSLNGVDYKSVVDMHRAGYAVFQSLDASQQKKSDAGRVPGDIATGPSDDGHVPRRIGLAVADMTKDQRQLLLDTIQLWVSIQPDENAEPRLQEIEAQLDQTHFAWRGNNEVNTPTYMRIQGPSLIIELLSTGGNFGRNARGMGHYHTIYRNPNTEYGRIK